jgi:hypothetical protein
MPEALNFEDELKRLVLRNPFQPFTLKLTNGESFDVTDNLQIAIAPEGNTGIFLHPKRGIVYFRKNQMVSVHVNETQEH